MTQIDISDSVAKQTVRFGRPIKGRQLIDAVRATCEASGSEFFEEKKYDDGWLHAVGQESRSPQKNLLVTPDRENAFIKPDESYTEAVVLRYDSPKGGSRTLARVYVEDEVKAVTDFAESLQRTVEHGPDAGAGRSRESVGRDEASVAQASLDAERGWGQRSGGYGSGGYGSGGYGSGGRGGFSKA